MRALIAALWESGCALSLFFNHAVSIDATALYASAERGDSTHGHGEPADCGPSRRDLSGGHAARASLAGDVARVVPVRVLLADFAVFAVDDQLALLVVGGRDP